MKIGLEYFPLDVTLDSKMELIEAEFGLTGFGVIVKLLGEIYGKQGYYIEWTNEVALLFAQKNGLGGSVVSEIVAASIRRSMFDMEIFNKYHILTSRGIQKRYFDAVSRRKEIEVDDNILLVDPAQICKNVNIKHKNAYISFENDDTYKQSKVEESKVKESRVEESTAALSAGECFPEILTAYQSQTGQRPSAGQETALRRYAAKLGSDVVLEAFKITKERGVTNWSYSKRILDDWVAANVDSIAKVCAARGRARMNATVGLNTPEAVERAKRDMNHLDKLLGEVNANVKTQ